jgi:hypothetical protein
MALHPNLPSDPHSRPADLAPPPIPLSYAPAQPSGRTVDAGVLLAAGIYWGLAGGLILIVNIAVIPLFTRVLADFKVQLTALSATAFRFASVIQHGGWLLLLAVVPAAVILSGILAARSPHPKRIRRLSYLLAMLLALLCAGLPLLGILLAYTSLLKAVGG